MFQKLLKGVQVYLFQNSLLNLIQKELIVEETEAH